MQVVGIRAVMATATASSQAPASPGAAWKCPPGAQASDAHCVRFAVGVAWSKGGDLAPTASYVCRRWNSEVGVWAKDACAPVANATNAAWNSSDILLEDAPDVANSSGAATAVVECACDADGLFAVVALVDEEPDLAGLGVYCAVPERRAVSRAAVFAVTAAAVALSIAAGVMIHRPLLLVEKASSAAAKKWKILPL